MKGDKFNSCKYLTDINCSYEMLIFMLVQVFAKYFLVEFYSEICHLSLVVKMLKLPKSLCCRH